MTTLDQFRKDSFSKNFMDSVIAIAFKRFKSNFTMNMQENFFMRQLDFKFFYKENLLGITSVSINCVHDKAVEDLFNRVAEEYYSMIESYFNLAIHNCVEFRKRS